MQNDNEPELIAQSLDGNSEAYAELVNRYKNAVYYHCFAIVRDEDVAEDIAQETFINAYYKLKQYKREYRLATWLFKISTNKCLTHLKKHSRETALDDAMTESLVTSQPSPHTNAIRSELHTAVTKLKPDYQAVISLYYWQGQDYATIAQILDVPVNTVRVWLLRAKDALRKELK